MNCAISVSTIMSRSILYYSIFIIAMYQFLSHMSTQLEGQNCPVTPIWPAWSLQILQSQVRLLEIFPWHGTEEGAIWCNGFRILNHVFHEHCLLGIYFRNDQAWHPKRSKLKGVSQALEVQDPFRPWKFKRNLIEFCDCHGMSRYVTVCHGMSWYVMVFSLSFNSFHPRKRQLVNHPRLSWSRSTRPIWTTNRAHLALAHVWQTRTSCHANGTKAARSLCLRWCDLILRNMWDNLIRRSWMGSRWRARWAAIWLQSSYYNILYKAQAWFVSTSCSINVLNVQTNRR